MSLNIHATRTADNSCYMLSLRGISPPQAAPRAPIHFLFVIDNSGSMEFEHKLKNCIKSLTFAFEHIAATDYISVITFNDAAESVVEGILATPEAKADILSKLADLKAHNGTNISEALTHMERVLHKLDHIGHIKHGAIFLTDGYATDGITSPDDLAGIFNDLLGSFENISISTVGYGTDHNSFLLKYIAQEGGGSYSIVSSLVNVAGVFGYIIGTLISCACYDVTLHVSNRFAAEVNTSYTVKYGGEGAVHGRVQPYEVRIGDIAVDQTVNVLFTSVAPFSVEIRGKVAATGEEYVERVELSAATAQVDMGHSIKTEELRYRLSKLLCAVSQNEIPIRQALQEKDVLLGEIRGIPQSDSTRLMVTELEYINFGVNHSVLSQHSAVFGMNRGMRVTDAGDVDLTMATPMQRGIAESMQAASQAAVLAPIPPMGCSPGAAAAAIDYGLPAPRRTMSRTATVRRI